MALQEVCGFGDPQGATATLCAGDARLPTVLRWPSIAHAPPGCRLEVSHGTTTLAFKFRHGVIAAADTRSSCGNLVFCPSSEKVIPIHSHLLGTTSGSSADCFVWMRVLARECRLYELRHGQRLTVAGAAKLLSAMLYRYKGLEVCVATTLCGWDRGGPALFYVYSDGTRLAGDLFSVGSGSPYAYSVLDAGYRHDMSTQEAYALARRAVCHATHRDAYSGGNVDLYHVRESGWTKVGRQDVFPFYYGLYQREGEEGRKEAAEGEEEEGEKDVYKEEGKQEEDKKDVCEEEEEEGQKNHEEERKMGLYEEVEDMQFIHEEEETVQGEEDEEEGPLHPCSVEPFL